MKRQILTALSLTLLVSSSLTLNAMHKSKKKKKNGGSHITLNDFMPSNVASSSSSSSSSAITPTQALDIVPVPGVALPATLDIADAASSRSNSALDGDFSFEYAMVPNSSAANSSSAPADEFDPKDTAPQRAALFGAIVALEYKKNKGLKHIDVFHGLQRDAKLKALYEDESSELQREALIKLFDDTETNQVISHTAAPTVEPMQSAPLTREERYAAKYVIAQWRLNVTKKKLARFQNAWLQDDGSSLEDKWRIAKLEAELEVLKSQPKPLPGQDSSEDEWSAMVRTARAQATHQQALDLFPSSSTQTQQPQSLPEHQLEKIDKDETFSLNSGDGREESSVDNNSSNNPFSNAAGATTTTTTSAAVAPAASGWGLGLGWLLGSSKK
jgi:hypothetical protein